MRLIGSAPGFVSIVGFVAVLKDAGTVPDRKDEWMMEIRGPREGRQALIRTI